MRLTARSRQATSRVAVDLAYQVELGRGRPPALGHALDHDPPDGAHARGAGGRRRGDLGRGGCGSRGPRRGGADVGRQDGAAGSGAAQRAHVQAALGGEPARLRGRRREARGRPVAGLPGVSPLHEGEDVRLLDAPSARRHLGDVDAVLLGDLPRQGDSVTIAGTKLLGRMLTRKVRHGQPAHSGHRRLSLRRCALRVKGTSNGGILLPLYNVQEALRRPLRRGCEISGSRRQVHEEPAQVPLFERLGQARLLLRLRLIGSVLLRGDPDAWMSVGSLDHPEDWPMTKHASWGPSIHVFIDTKIPWYEISDGLPQRELDVLAEAAKAYIARTSQ